MKKILIIGAGTAGITAAAELRTLHPENELEITILSNELKNDYSRIRLPEIVEGISQRDDIIIHTEQWFESKKIKIEAPVEATKIDRENKFVTAVKSGVESRYPYDALILATGASSFTPGMPSPDNPNSDSLFALRTLGDSEKLRKRILKYTDSAAVMGGGLLGLEAARALKESGVKRVHVLETAPRLLPRQMDSKASGMLEKYLESEGLIIHTGVNIDTNAFSTTSPSDVLEPLCNDSVQTIIYSMGVRSNKKIAEEAGIKCGKAIIIDGTTATSDPFIFAAGDCAEFEGISWCIVPAAIEQGKKAGQFAAKQLFPGDNSPEPYSQTIPRTTLKVGKKEAVSAGKAILSPEEENSGKWRIYYPEKYSTDDLYLRLVINTSDDTIAGALVYGNEGISRTWLSLLQKSQGKPCPQEWL